MARKLRVQYPGAIYHVMNRGARREATFLDEQDRELFLTVRYSKRAPSEDLSRQRDAKRWLRKREWRL